MNRITSASNGSLDNEPRLTGVSDEELMFVTGGSFWDWLTSAASWVKDHVFVSVANHVFGYKGTF